MVRIPPKTVSWFRNTFTHYGELQVPSTVKRDLTVKEIIPGAVSPVRRSSFVQTPGEPARQVTAQVPDQLRLGQVAVKHAANKPKLGDVLDMTPAVALKPGDIVGRGNGLKLDTMAQGGLGVTVERFVRTGRWQPYKADIGHVGIVGVGPNGQMGIYEIFVGHPEPALEKLMPERLRRKPHTFVRFVTTDQFFNVVPEGFMRTTMVVRHPDPKVAAKSAARARKLFDTQLTPDGKRAFAWFTDANRHLDPSVKDRSGPCSAFVNAAYDYRLNRPVGIPVSPEAIMDESGMQMVGYKTIETIKASSDGVFRF